MPPLPSTGVPCSTTICLGVNATSHSAHQRPHQRCCGATLVLAGAALQSTTSSPSPPPGLERRFVGTPSPNHHCNHCCPLHRHCHHHGMHNCPLPARTAPRHQFNDVSPSNDCDNDAVDAMSAGNLIRDRRTHSISATSSSLSSSSLPCLPSDLLSALCLFVSYCLRHDRCGRCHLASATSPLVRHTLARHRR
jgi:hypothetical protein